MQTTDSRPADRPVERRRGKQRSGSRPGSAPEAADDSWFGVLGLASDTQPRDAAGADDANGRMGAGVDDRRMLTHRARRMIRDPDSALARIHRAYAGARVAIGLALVAGSVALQCVGLRTSPLLLALRAAYAVQSLAVWWWPRLGGLAVRPSGPGTVRQRRVWLATIGVDLFAFGTLHLPAREAIGVLTAQSNAQVSPADRAVAT